MNDERAKVRVGQCFGCNRLVIPAPWNPATLHLLKREGRLVFYEYLCSNHDCGANKIAEQ